jgi:ketosteroid isomerase-like protein
VSSKGFAYLETSWLRNGVPEDMKTLTHWVAPILAAWFAVTPVETSGATPSTNTTSASSANAIASPADVVGRFFEALRGRDSAAALSLLDAQVVVYESGNVEHSRAEYASKHLPADMDYLKSRTQTVLSRASGDDGNIAWVATESRSRTAGSTSQESIGTETMILRRNDDAWRIVHIHWSSRKVPAT